MTDNCLIEQAQAIRAGKDWRRHTVDGITHKVTKPKRISVGYSSASSTSSTTSSVTVDEQQSVDLMSVGSDSDFDCVQQQNSFLHNPSSPTSVFFQPLEQLSSLTTLHRTLTQTVLRFDQLTTSFINSRNQLRLVLDGVDEQERQYEACIEEIGQLRFERRFLREVVQLAERKRGFVGSIGVEEMGNKRWSTPLKSGSMDMDDKASRRWTVGASAMRFSNLSATSFDDPDMPGTPTSSTTFLPHMDDENRVTVDDLASRRVQRAAFSAMNQTIRETLLIPNMGLTGTIDPLRDVVMDDSVETASNRSRSPSPRSSTTSRHHIPKPTPTQTLHSRITHLTTLISHLQPTVESLREAIDDVVAGPALAYRAWLREAEIEREMLRVECEGLREAREGVKTATTKLVGDVIEDMEGRIEKTREALSGLWADGNEGQDIDEWETESVYFSCDEGNDDDEER